MNWINIKKILPGDIGYERFDYDWVIVGYMDEDNRMSWKVGRYVSTSGWELMCNHCPSAYAFDSVGDLQVNQITHWMPIKQIDGE